MLFKTIFRHWNCFLLSVAADGNDGHGLKLEKAGPTYHELFQVFMLCLRNHPENNIKLSAPCLILQERFVLVGHRGYVHTLPDSFADWCRLVRLIHVHADWWMLLQVGAVLHVGVGFCRLNQFGAGWFSLVQFSLACCRV